MPRLRLSSNLTEHIAGRYYNSPSKVLTKSVNTEMHFHRAGKPSANQNAEHLKSETRLSSEDQYKVSSKSVNKSTAHAVGR